VNSKVKVTWIIIVHCLPLTCLICLSMFYLSNVGFKDNIIHSAIVTKTKHKSSTSQCIIWQSIKQNYNFRTLFSIANHTLRSSHHFKQFATHNTNNHIMYIMKHYEVKNLCCNTDFSLQPNRFTQCIVIAGQKVTGLRLRVRCLVGLFSCKGLEWKPNLNDFKHIAPNVSMRCSLVDYFCK